MKKGSLIIFMACFAGLCAYLFTAFYDEAEKTALRQLNTEQKVHAKQAAHGIEAFFTTWTGILSSLSKIDAIVNADAEGKRFMTLFYESHREQIRTITRVDERGRILHTVPHVIAVGSDISGQKHVQEILRDHKPVVSDVFRTVQGFDAVALHVPVFSGAKFKGTIAITIAFETLAKSYLEVIKIGKTGYAWMISRDGIMLYSPVPDLTGKSIFDTCRDFPSVISMAKDMMRGHEGTAAYIFDRIGDKRVALHKKYAVYMPVHTDNSFWSIVVASSEEDALSSIASLRNRLLLVIGIIFLGGALFSIMSAKAWLIVAEEKKRKKAEEALRDSLQYNRLLFELSPIGLVLCRMDGSLVDVNEGFSNIIGRTVEETLKQTYWDITPKKYAEQELAQLKSLEEKGRYGPYEKEYIHKDGHLVPVQLSGLVINKGGEQHIWSSVEDITERKNAEEELKKHREHLEALVVERTAVIAEKVQELKNSQQALQCLLEDVNETNEKLKEMDRLKSMFIASMSHELRTPLNSVIGFSSIILNEWTGPLNPEQKENLATVLKAGRHLLSLINDVIDVSKIEAGTIDSQIEDFDLNDVMNEAAGMFVKEAGEKGLVFTVESISLPMRTDRRRLLQCVINIISNAVKFTESGSVRVSVRKVRSRESGVRRQPSLVE